MLILGLKGPGVLRDTHSLNKYSRKVQKYISFLIILHEMLPIKLLTPSLN